MSGVEKVGGEREEGMVKVNTESSSIFPLRYCTIVLQEVTTSIKACTYFETIHNYLSLYNHVAWPSFYLLFQVSGFPLCLNFP